MTLLFCVLGDLIHIVKILVFCNMFFVFQKRAFNHKRLVMVIIGFIMSVVSTIIYVCDNDILETFIYIILIILLIFTLYRERIHSIVIATIWMIVTLSMIDVMTSILFDISMELINIECEVISNLAVSLISLILVYVVGRIYKKNSSATMKSIGIVNLMGITILMAVDTLVVTVVAVMNIELNLEKNRNIYLLAIVFAIIGVFIQLAAVILLFTQRNVYKEKEAITDKYLNEQKNYYEYLENREKETKKFRHDLRSHMEVISNLISNHEYEKMNSYLEKMHMKINTFGNLVTVQNGIVDAIINQYYTKAKQSGVKMEVKGRFPTDCAIDAFDLCTIFSNILSNALEAAIETEEKYILVECRYNDKNIIIVVKNSFNNELQNSGLQWKTRKEDTDYHGYGLENIKDSVVKYDGIFDIEVNDNIFILTILFGNKGK